MQCSDEDPKWFIDQNGLNRGSEQIPWCQLFQLKWHGTGLFLIWLGLFIIFLIVIFNFENDFPQWSRIFTTWDDFRIAATLSGCYLVAFIYVVVWRAWCRVFTPVASREEAL